MLSQKIGFVGAGQMARALARGFVDAQLTAPADIAASDPNSKAREDFSQAVPGSQTTGDNREVVARSEVVFLAVKPQQMSTLLQDLRSAITPGHLIISIAAGVRLAKLQEDLQGQGRLVRVMPNTPCLVNESASGYCLGPGATDTDAQLVERLLSAVGRAYQVDEKLLDAVTGLSGSGPAFVYLMIEALSDGGVRMGLPRPIALALAAQTVKGAAQMVLTTEEHPAVLKDRVASPGGTTIAGIQALEDHGFRAALMAAVEAATQRATELGSS